MNSLIASLNQWSENVLGFVWPMLWQSSLLIFVLFGLDLALKRKLRPAVRYTLWLIVLVKLMLPPSVAFPSGIGWWVRSRAAIVDSRAEHLATLRVTYGPATLPPASETALQPAAVISSPTLSQSVLVVASSVTVSMALLTWMLIRWWQVAGRVRSSAPAPGWLRSLLDACRSDAGVAGEVRLRVVEHAMSPAVCGLLRPTVLVPRTLIEGLSPEQLRPVLLHELIHLRRGDVWVNFAQTLLQIAYWWHPLLWLANARIRRVREEAVDDAVMLSLGDQNTVYAPTLLEVARLALQRPMATLGLIGILESPGALRQRIERLVEFRPPRRAGLTFVSALSVLGFAALAVPMGQAPAGGPAQKANSAPDESLWPDRRFPGYHIIALEPRFLIVEGNNLRSQFPSLLDSPVPLTFTADEIPSLDAKLSQVGAAPHTWAQPLTIEKFSGGVFHWLIGGSTSNQVSYLTRELGGKTVVTGADATFLATELDWRPLELNLVPWYQEGGILCQLRLSLGSDPANSKEAELIIPRRGAAVWAVLTDPALRKYQLVVLQESPEKTNIANSAITVTNSAKRINILIQEAKSLYETGKSPEAKAKLLKVLQEDPDNKAAAYYLNLVREAEFKRAHKPASDDWPPKQSDVASIDPKALFTRIFKVDPNTFAESLRNVTGMDLGKTNNTVLPLKEFFTSLGVDFQPPKTVYYKDKEGMLLVRGSLADLDAIEDAINFLNSSPPQVNVKVKFVELPVKLAKEFWDGLTNNASRVAILTEPQARVALKALESKEGESVVNQANVTTLSGRQTEIQLADEIAVSVFTNATWRDPSSQAMTWVTNKVPVGSKVDIYPVVRPDGYTIQLTVSASTTEFLGYDDPGQFVPQTESGLATPLTAPLPTPHFRTLQIPTQTAIFWNGQTLVLGRSGQTHASQVPVFGGDIPLVGRLFRSEPKDKDFIVFLTPTIIDPAGNRVHTDDERPTPKVFQRTNPPKPASR